LTGIVLIVFGLLALATPLVAGTAVVYVIGGLLLVTGAVQFIQGWRADSWSSKLLSMVLGVLTSVCGIAVLAHPLWRLTVLTLVLAIFFVVEGVWKITASFSFRPATGWPAMLVSGLLAVLLGVIIWYQWPISGLWAVGILVGVDLLFTGISMVMLAITVKRVRKTPSTASAQDDPDLNNRPR